MISITGPLGRSVDDLVILQKLMISDFVFESDVIVPPLAFDDAIVAEYETKHQTVPVFYRSEPICKEAQQPYGKG